MEEDTNELLKQLLIKLDTNKAPKNKITFSKIILVASNSVVFLLLAFYCYMSLAIFKYTGSYDLNSITTIILAFLGEITVSNGFYYWKSKIEFEIRNNIPREGNI